LRVVFVGTSVARASAVGRHYYSSWNNSFWELLRKAGLTEGALLAPQQDRLLLGYGIGLTDLVKSRVASSDSLLHRSDYDVPGFLEKIHRYTPRVLAFNGKTAAREVFGALDFGAPRLGLAEAGIGKARVYTLPSSSGSSADPRHHAPKVSKVAWWIEFGEWLRGTESAESSA
jgi:TDG/mug DNA glycosylase family protein